MKRRILTSIGFIVAGLLIGLGVGYQLGCTAMANCINNYNRSNDTTRDINYEHYCDSIYEVNPNYYLMYLQKLMNFRIIQMNTENGGRIKININNNNYYV